MRGNRSKLGRWGVSKLLHTERSVDREQKRRANTSTNPQELSLLAEDEDLGVRFFVAANRHTSLGSRIYLAGDPEATVRTGVAMALAWDPLATRSTRQIITDLATKLAGDPNVLVRLALVENRQLPPTVFDTLVRDPEEMVRWKLASNLDTPSRVLTQLTSDAKHPVRIAALPHRKPPVPLPTPLPASTDPHVGRAVSPGVEPRESGGQAAGPGRGPAGPEAAHRRAHRHGSR